MAEGQVAGHIACYPDGENMEVTYWLGKGVLGKRISDSSAQAECSTLL